MFLSNTVKRGRNVPTKRFFSRGRNFAREFMLENTTVYPFPHGPVPVLGPRPLPALHPPTLTQLRGEIDDGFAMCISGSGWWPNPVEIYHGYARGKFDDLFVEKGDSIRESTNENTNDRTI